MGLMRLRVRRGLTTKTVHVPVMLENVIAILRQHPPKRILDATFGGGGYSRALLEEFDGCTITAIDRDLDALKKARPIISMYPNRLRTIHIPFGNLSQLGDEESFGAAIFDLGVSTDQRSVQLLTSQRGFSFRIAGPLDMRMDQSQSLTAADIINWYPKSKLYDVIRKYGDEVHAAKIAQAIVDERRLGPICSTLQLAAIVQRCVPMSAQGKSPNYTHPATKTFQAIRIEVNSEVSQLRDGLSGAFDLLGNRGAMIVISFHALEDKAVKDFFKLKIKERAAEPLIGGVATPHPSELERNRKSRSAKLRAVLKVQC